MNFEMKTRDPFFDIAKLLVIFMVVFRHTMFASETLLFPTWVANATVGMNMPFFFILSGWFAWPTIEACDWSKLGRHLKSYMWPTITTIVLFASILPFIDGTAWRVDEVLVRSVKTWLFGPWFIWVLCECYLIVFLAHGRGRSFGKTMGIVLVVFLFLMLLPDCRGIVFKTFLRDMLPYFVIGTVFRYFRFRPWERNGMGAFALVTFVLIVIFEGDARQIGMSFYHTDSSWRAFMDIRGALTLFARPAMGILGSIGFMWVVHKCVGLLMESSRKVLCVLARGGGLTLSIYLLHQWILSRIVVAWPNIVSTRSDVVMLSVVLFIGVWGISEITVNQIPGVRKWFWGR